MGHIEKRGFDHGFGKFVSGRIIFKISGAKVVQVVQCLTPEPLHHSNTDNNTVKLRHFPNASCLDLSGREKNNRNLTVKLHLTPVNMASYLIEY
jgi:hypothetical protein